MAMRLSGLMSGMDTESIIQQLVASRQTKVDDAKKAQTKLSWKQDAWKSLNTKLQNLQQKYLSKMRFSDAYTKKTTKVSNSSAVSVITGEDAMNGVQSLDINQLAKTGALTGAVLGGGKQDYNAMTKLSDLGVDFKGGTGTISVKSGGNTVDITVKEDSTISDVLTELKNAGVKANFDAKNQRFFVYASDSGKDNDFTIEAKTGDANGSAALTALGLDANKGAKKTAGQNAVIELNGAEFESSTNVFEINGLTFTALSEATNITVTTQNDTDGIYNVVKDFLKAYNEIVNEMDKLYNAESSKGYEPLTSDEKEAMSESEIEEWEKKIKDSLLRRDDNLSTISSALKEVMSGGITLDNGKTMYLFDFGIETLGYFEAPNNEKNAYHIYGDEDDSYTSGKADILKGMISSDPNTVTEFFTKLSQNLYDKMSELSSSVTNTRTFGTFYDDKKMKSDYDDYTTKIKELEQKVADYEDKWYAKFAAMETALAKMQSNASAVTALLGG